MSKPYIRPWPTFSWFTRRPGYMLFMVRELTAVFIAIYAVSLLCFLARLGRGPDAYAELIQELKSPGWIALHIVALAAAVWHAVTWFNLTPKAMPVFFGEKRAPGPLIAIGMGYAPWLVVTAIILVLVLR